MFTNWAKPCNESNKTRLNKARLQSCFFLFARQKCLLLLSATKYRNKINVQAKAEQWSTLNSHKALFAAKREERGTHTNYKDATILPPPTRSANYSSFHYWKDLHSTKRKGESYKKQLSTTNQHTFYHAWLSALDCRDFFIAGELLRPLGVHGQGAWAPVAADAWLPRGRAPPAAAQGLRRRRALPATHDPRQLRWHDPASSLQGIPASFKQDPLSGRFLGGGGGCSALVIQKAVKHRTPKYCLVLEILTQVSLQQ